VRDFTGNRLGGTRVAGARYQAGRRLLTLDQRTRKTEGRAHNSRVDPASTDPSTRDQSTRDAIIDAATTCFAAFGFEATTNKMIARNAGVAPGLLYHYFESKLELYAAVYSKITRYRYDRSRAVLESDAPLADKVIALAQDLIAMWQSDPSYVEFQARTLADAHHKVSLRDSLRDASGETNALWTKIVEEAKGQGDIRADLPTQAVVDACICWFSSLVMVLPARGVDRALAATRIFAEGLEGLKPRPAG
jgi:AcrR family transcriptional regulator